MRRMQRGRKGFTLIEILVVIVIIGVLSIIGVSKYTEFTTRSRVRGCIANQTTIDKTMGVWESQNVAIPVNAVHTVTFDQNGLITGSTLGGLAAGANNLLVAAAPDNGCIVRLTKDEDVFACPEQANVVGSVEAFHAAAAAAAYQFESHGDPNFGGAGPQTTLRGKTRGAVCQFFGGGAGPDGTTSTEHNPA